MDLLLKILAWIIVVVFGGAFVFYVLLVISYMWNEFKGIIIGGVAIIAFIWAFWYLFG